MPDWHLSLAIAARPADPLEAVWRFVRRRRQLLAALAALAFTLALGWYEPVAPPLGWTLGGLAGVLGLGLIAWHLARLTVLPTAATLPAALVAASLAVALFPALAPQAALVPAFLALAAASGNSGQRVAALLVQCGAFAMFAAARLNHVGIACGGVTMLGTAAFLVVSRGLGAANDNPSMERAVTNSRLMLVPHYASEGTDPESGVGSKDGNVQQQ